MKRGQIKDVFSAVFADFIQGIYVTKSYSCDEILIC